MRRVLGLLLAVVIIVGCKLLTSPSDSTSNSSSNSASSPVVSPPIEKGYVAASEGCCIENRNGRAFFQYDGNKYPLPQVFPGRGFFVAAVSSATHELLFPVQNFDTYLSTSTAADGAWPIMIEFLDSIPNGAIIMFAVADEAGLTSGGSGGCGGDGYSPESPAATTCCRLLTAPIIETGRKLIESLGSTMISGYCYRNSWSMITVKGGGKKDESLIRSGQAKTTYIP